MVFSLGDTVNATTMTDVPPVEGKSDFNGTEWVMNLSEAKASAEARIDDGFINQFKSGSFLSTTLNIVVDNRRFNEKHDMANLEWKIRKGIYPINWKGLTEWAVIADELMALALLNEMIDNGDARYQNKFAKEKAILDAFALEGNATTPTTAADYDAIVW